MRTPTPVAGIAGRDAKAAQGPILAPVSAAENPAPAPLADSPAEARGRRILSTAFVGVGPDGHLTVEANDGRVLVLRNVTMRPKNYCGLHVAGTSGPAKYCGGYAEIMAARPGGAPAVPSPVDPKDNPAGAKAGPGHT